MTRVFALVMAVTLGLAASAARAADLKLGIVGTDTSHVVASGSSKVFVQADVTHVPFLFARNPGWHAFYDQDGPKAEATRRAFFDRVIAEKGMICGYHLGFPNVGTLSKDGNGYAFAAVKA